jgi:CRP-like cAMP-binding protein
MLVFSQEIMAEAVSNQNVLEDPLNYLPHSPVSEYRKGEAIYDSSRHPPDLYLVVEGCVKVSRFIDHNEIIIDLCRPDDFFGEQAFLGTGIPETAVALETSKVMSWHVDTVRKLIARSPQLGVALVQLLARHGQDLGERIGMLSVDYTSRRLARAIVKLGERLGRPEGPGGVHLMPLPHKLLAQYIGTRREAVTHCMNQFRRQGLVSYSRRGMVVFPDAIRAWLKEDRPPATGSPLHAVQGSPLNHVV